jgi:hypothetical protein
VFFPGFRCHIGAGADFERFSVNNRGFRETLFSVWQKKWYVRDTGLFREAQGFFCERRFIEGIWVIFQFNRKDSVEMTKSRVNMGFYRYMGYRQLSQINRDAAGGILE